MQGDLEDKGWKVHMLPYEVSSRGQFKIKIEAGQLIFKQLSKIALLSTFSISHAYQTEELGVTPSSQTLIDPGTGLQRLCLAYSFNHLLFFSTFSLDKGVFSLQQILMVFKEFVNLVFN